MRYVKKFMRHGEANCSGLPSRLQEVAAPGLLVAAMLLTAATAQAQQIATDKYSYQPGETVTISGQGWQPNEAVSLVIANNSGIRALYDVQVAAGSDGNFRHQAYVVQETDRDQMLTLSARGAAGAEVMVALRSGVAPGALRCPALAASGPTSYGFSSGEAINCSIEGASDLSAAQQAGSGPLDVVVKCGNGLLQRANVTSVSGANIAFSWTPPASGCAASTVSYGPVKGCNASGKCVSFPAEGNDASSSVISGGAVDSAAGFSDLRQALTTECETPAGIAVEKWPKNGAFAEGAQAIYNFVVTNPAPAGYRAAGSVVLKDQLPGNGNLVWQSATPSQGSCVNPVVNNLLDCTLGAIEPQASATVTVKTAATTPVTACRTQPNPLATVTADGGVSAHDFASLTCTQSSPAQLKVVQSPKNGTFAQGSQLVYTFVVSNPAAAGSAAATNVQLKDQLPGYGGLQWLSGSATAGNCTLVNNFLSCSLGDLPAQGSVTVTVKSSATTPLEACQAQPNPTASATADGGLAVQDSGSLICTPPAPPQLKVVQNPKSGTFIQGSQISYSMVVSNPASPGAAVANNVQLADVLPTTGGLTWTSVQTSQGACSFTTNNLNCALGSIAAGGSATVTVLTPATTPGAACGWQQSAATATADGGLLSRDSGSHNCVPASPALSLSKTPSILQPRPGQPVTYTYRVKNTGNVDLSNVTVKDDNGTPLDPSDDVTVGTLATLAKGDSATLQATMVPSKASIVATLGSAGPSRFAVLSLGGDAAHKKAGIFCSNGFVTGDIGIASYGSFVNNAPCTETGNFYKGVNVSYSGPGHLKGATITDEDMMNALRYDAFYAAEYFAGLPVTPSVQKQFPTNGAISGTRTVTGTPGKNVVKLPGLTLNGNLVLSGPPGTQFVLNISGTFNLHSGNITTAGGVGPYDVVYNITDKFASVGTMVPTTAIGVLLAPYNAIKVMDSAYFYGTVIGGYNQVITLMSATRVVPPTPPPPLVTNTATATGAYGNTPVTVTTTATVFTGSTTNYTPPEPD